MNRRETLARLGSAVLLSVASSWASPVLAARKARPAALLVPLSGPRAALGLSMARAAALVQSGDGLRAFDTGGTPHGAARAAQQAIRAGVGLIVGPLLSEEAGPAVRAAQGRAPVISFTNDPAARSAGAFVFGITARQVTGSVLRYARSRGVRHVAVIGDGSPWAKAAMTAAAALQGELNLDVRGIEVAAGQPLPAAGEAPDAVLIPGGSEPLLAAARNLKDTGIQLLGTFQALDHRPVALETLAGAWFASPDPDAFAGFASEYEARNGGNPGAIAALAYDGARIVKVLREANALNREGLLGQASFDCVTGPLRFRADGSVARDLAILVASPAGYEKVATSRGA